MKKFSLIVAFFLCIAGIILLSFDIQFFPSFYDVRYMGIASLVGAVCIILLPRFLQVPHTDPHAEKKNHGVDVLQFCLTFALLNNALGDLGLYELYKVGFEYDKLVHFVTPLVLTVLLHKFFEERFEFSHRSALLLTFGIIFLGALSWELYEYFADLIFQTHIYGVFGTDIVRDTILDVSCGTMGTLSGLLLLLKHPKFKHHA